MFLFLGGKWSEEAIDRFDELSHCAKWSELMARVVEFQEIDGERIPCLELIDTKQEMVGYDLTSILQLDR